MTISKQEELLALLVKKEIISDEIRKEVLEESLKSKVDIESILMKNDKIDFESVIQAKAELYGLLYENLSDTNVGIDVLNIISLEAAENYKIVCFAKVGNKIKIGITNPDDYQATEAINFLAKKEGYSTEYYLISKLSFDKIFKQYKNLEREVSRALERKAEEEAKDEVVEEKKEELEDMIKTAPVAKIVSVIIRHAVEGRASDIHIEPSKNNSRIRYRIDGVLHTSLVLPKNVHDSIVSRIKVLASLKLDETRIPQDGRIRLSIGGKDIDFRISILPLVGEEKVVMRILDTTKGAPTLEELGYTGRSYRVIQENIKETTGMFLVTGPTGSGKSTTLFSVLNLLNQEGVNISTLEDPVEYFIKGVNQSQIRPTIGFTFASGLRALLRQDPDVIMVGEIRDNETAELAIHAGLTGHFVLSTLHTNSAMGAIPRLLDMRVESFLLGSTLNIVIAQRLARKICPFCRIGDKLPPDILERIEEQIKMIPPKILDEELGGMDFQNVGNLKFYKGKGCPRCGKTGYTGRVAIVEVLEVNDEIKEIVIDDTKNLGMKDIVASQDFITMMQDGLVKSLKGITTMEEVLRIMRD